MPDLNDAIQQIKAGDRTAGRQILEELLEVEENDEQIWLWLSMVVDTNDDREICLENALALDPRNSIAKRGLESLHSGSFKTNELLSELIEEFDGSTEPEKRVPTTFLDDFVIGGEEDGSFFADDEENSSFSASPKKKPAQKAKGGSKINFRIVILGVLALLLIIVLGALAFSSMFLLSGDNPPPTVVQSGQDTAAPAVDATPESTPIPEDTSTPAPIETPTETPTPKLRLPTAPPTEPPTPLATRVVSPTAQGN
jgi:hypothetical protein